MTLFAEGSCGIRSIIQTGLPYRGIQSEQRSLFHSAVMYAFDVGFHDHLFMTRILVLAFTVEFTASPNVN